MAGIHIGDVAVWLGEPPSADPWSGGPRPLIGPERAHALQHFKARRVEAHMYTFWHCPYTGPRRCIVAADVDWESSGV
jgi:hypothetical protein